jgi:hypothetical protein
VPGAVSLEEKQMGVKLTIQLHLVPVLRMSESYIATPHHIFMTALCDIVIFEL